MAMKLYINLPVSDLSKATAFYEAIGFTKNLKFSNADASGMAYKDEFALMLLTHHFTKTFLPAWREIADSHKTCEVLNALQLNSKEEVDAFVQNAITAGWKITLEYDHGFMYGRDFEDLDGHIWEVFWMDASHGTAV
jgi:uncharacterized protein